MVTPARTTLHSKHRRVASMVQRRTSPGSSGGTSSSRSAHEHQLPPGVSRPPTLARAAEARISLKGSSSSEAASSTTAPHAPRQPRVPAAHAVSLLTAHEGVTHPTPTASGQRRASRWTSQMRTQPPFLTVTRSPLIVSIDAQAKLYLNLGASDDLALNIETVKQRVATVLKRNPEKAVMVWGDAAVPYGEVVALMSELQEAGALSVGLVTEAPARRQ